MDNHGGDLRQGASVQHHTTFSLSCDSIDVRCTGLNYQYYRPTKSSYKGFIYVINQTYMQLGCIH